MGTNLGFSSSNHPKTDGQTEVTNMSLRNILRSLVSEHPKQWDQAPPQAQFAYNDSPNRSTRLSLFQIVYGMQSRGIYELRNLGKIEMRRVDVEDFAIST